jgi:hypothetical protein
MSGERTQVEVALTQTVPKAIIGAAFFAGVAPAFSSPGRLASRLLIGAK